MTKDTKLDAALGHGQLGGGRGVLDLDVLLQQREHLLHVDEVLLAEREKTQGQRQASASVWRARTWITR